MRLRHRGCAAAVVALVLLSACSAGPEGAVRGFYKALDANDIEAAKGHLSSQITDILGDGKLDMALGEGARSMAQCGGLDKVNVSLSGEGSSRSGTAEVLFDGDCPAKQDQVSLVQEDGDWKIGLGK
jgi:hypothetical protein